VTYLVATTSELEIKTNKVARALNFEIPIISEDWLHDCAKAGKKLDIKKYILKED
jgi:hypothetical protein